MRVSVLLATTVLATTVATAVAAPPAAPTVAAAPMHSSGAKAPYPRLTKFPDAAIRAAVNSLLAGKEKEDRDNYADCLAQIKEQKQKPDAESWNNDITVAYLSAHYMTVNVVQSYYCAGAYPTNGAEAPINIDLKTGREIDWTTMFKPGFLSDGEKAGALTKLYLARYSKKKDDAECLGAVKESDPSGSAIFWLDAKQGLIFQPDYPHVMAACGLPHGSVVSRSRAVSEGHGASGRTQGVRALAIQRRWGAPRAPASAGSRRASAR